MAELPIPPSKPAKISFDSGEFRLEASSGGWATVLIVVFLLLWQLIRLLSRRRSRSLAGDSSSLPIPSVSSNRDSSSATLKLVSDVDLRDLMTSLEGKLGEKERWEEVVDKRSDSVSYSAKCCRPKDGPLKYFSITTFENCSTELLRDFYMDNEYRKEWDKTLIEHEQLQVDESSATEIGRTIKKFPLLTPREYILAWCTWEGKDKTFYCFTKDCEHPLAPRQKKYVRVGFFRSGWRIRKVPGRDACEIMMVHQEDAGLNVEMAKLAFAKGVWTYISKMNMALREYSSSRPSQSSSIITLHRLIQKVPPALENDEGTMNNGAPESVGTASSRLNAMDESGKVLSRKSSVKWIANGMLLLGGIVCLSKGRSNLATQVAVACIVKKFIRNGKESGQTEITERSRGKRDRRHRLFPESQLHRDY